MSMLRSPKRLFLAASLTLSACGSDEAPAPATSTEATTSLFVFPASLDELAAATFFDQPFPSDLRVDADGAARFSGFPNPFSIPIVDAYINASHGLLHGFSPAAGIYFRFTGPIDPATLPKDPGASVASDASVRIVDVDPASPELGKSHFAQFRWQEAESAYWQKNTLAVLPMIGEPLRPKTRYAVVVTNHVHTPRGEAVLASAEMEEALGRRPVSERTRAAHDLFAPAIVEVEKTGLLAKDIVHMTVFTTNDPTEELFAAFDDVAKSVPAPTARDWQAKDQSGTYDVYEGTYGPSPNYQAGSAPYAKANSGGAFGLENGKPKLQNTFDLRFAITVPNAAACPLPPSGYPVVLYAHGTGGDYRSFIGDGTGPTLAGRCMATMGIDQIFHGTRPGAPPESDPQRDSSIQFLFFNFDNPLAGRTNNRQAAIDLVQQARLFTGTPTKVPAAVSRTAADIAFDPSRVMFFGHSQGGLNGPLFLAGSPLVRGGVLSGSGAVLGLALLDKKKPVDIGAAVRLLLGLTDPDLAKDLDIFHPALMLVQSIVDVADPTNYASYIARAPRAGNAPKCVFQTEGVTSTGDGDSYAPPSTIEALSVGIGLPRVAPGIHAIPAATFAGIADVSIPADGLSGNLANGQATGVLAQFVPPAGRDGHFVVFDIAAARNQAAGFLMDLAADPKGRVPQ